MPSVLGKYQLLQTLGKGAHSKVKLALNKQTREYFAVKILKKQNKNIDQKFLDLVMTEVEALTHLHHLNIVNMVEFSNDGVV
jgi:serine/threonine protein kinase